jgi:mono/diheme cytochrome c family protein
LDKPFTRFDLIRDSWNVSGLFWKVVILAGLMILSACSGESLDSQPSLGTVQTALTVHPEPPADYADKTNPLTADTSTVSEGATFYQADCASCHGTEGRGDGPAGANYDPKPTNLAATQKNSSDAYLFWRISEGGAMQPFNSVMPGWKGLMSDKRIWQVITYIRTLKP